MMSSVERLRFNLKFDLLDVGLVGKASDGELVVTILVDGRNVLARPLTDRLLRSPESVSKASDMIGFAPDRILGGQSPLLPTTEPRRVALVRCSCGYAECRSTTAVISGDDAIVSWSRFVHFEEKAVFYAPTDADDPDDASGTPLALETLTFAADAYRAEVARATRQWTDGTR